MVALATKQPEDLCRRLLTSFGGIRCGQIVADWYLWELVLNERRDLKAIVEIGTWEGGFSRYLKAQADARGMDFRTYDAVVPEVPPPGFERLDVFAYPLAVAEFFHGREPLALLCDGGNKPRELKTFSELLEAGSVVVAHDWMTETMPADVPDSLRPVYEACCDRLGSMSRVFEVV